MVQVKGKNAVLRNGKEMPLLGLGCWLSEPGDVAKAVEVALDSGYRHIDTAALYTNESEVGEGIRKWLKKSPNHRREDIFVVTKLPLTGMDPEGVEKYMKISLDKLGLSYVDLYLVHCTIGLKRTDVNDLFPKRADGSLDVDYSTDLIKIWKAMEKLVDNGSAKSIGVSNFSVRQLRKIHAIARIPPVTNQVEMHVYYQQKELQEYSNENNMVITAYANLGSPGRDKMKGAFGSSAKVLDDPIVHLIADYHKVTAAQVLIRYIIQLGVVAIPKSVNPSRIKTNGDVFSFQLSPLEMEALKSLDKGSQGRTFCMATNIPGSILHPELPDNMLDKLY